MLFAKKERKIRRILVVEDEPLVAFDNEYLLSDAGYEVVATVDRCREAEKVIETEQLDLVLTDLQLRGERDGHEVARAAQARGVPVLFVTGNCPDLSLGLAVGCLTKPYSDKVLLTALRTVDDLQQGRKLKKVPPALILATPAG